MRFIDIVTISLGWVFLGNAFHLPLAAALVAGIMTTTFAFYLSRVIEDDRK